MANTIARLFIGVLMSVGGALLATPLCLCGVAQVEQTSAESVTKPGPVPVTSRVHAENDTAAPEGEDIVFINDTPDSVPNVDKTAPVLTPQEERLCSKPPPNFSRPRYQKICTAHGIEAPSADCYNYLFDAWIRSDQKVSPSFHRPSYCMED